MNVFRMSFVSLRKPLRMARDRSVQELSFPLQELVRSPPRVGVHRRSLNDWRPSAIASHFYVGNGDAAISAVYGGPGPKSIGDLNTWGGMATIVTIDMFQGVEDLAGCRGWFRDALSRRDQYRHRLAGILRVGLGVSRRNLRHRRRVQSAALQRPSCRFWRSVPWPRALTMTRSANVNSANAEDLSWLDRRQRHRGRYLGKNVGVERVEALLFPPIKWLTGRHHEPGR